jgi:hypothetical protein
MIDNDDQGGMRGGGEEVQEEDEEPEDTSPVAVLCREIEGLCNTSDGSLSCCILYKYRAGAGAGGAAADDNGTKDLFLTYVTSKGTPDFVKALVAYFQDFGGRRVVEYEEKILMWANTERRKELALSANKDNYTEAKDACNSLYTDHAALLEFVLVLLECAPEYRAIVGDDEYVPYLFRETASVCPRLPYPMITSVVQVIKKRLG